MLKVLCTLSAIYWGKKFKLGSGVCISGTTFSGFMVIVATKFQTMAPIPKLHMTAPVAKLLECPKWLYIQWKIGTIARENAEQGSNKLQSINVTKWKLKNESSGVKK